MYELVQKAIEMQGIVRFFVSRRFEVGFVPGDDAGVFYSRVSDDDRESRDAQIVNHKASSHDTHIAIC
jgi:hypothetical protein